MAASALRTLADRLGILPEYVDQTGRETRVTTDETRIAILAAMGVDASTEERAASALDLLEAQRPLPHARARARDRPRLHVRAAFADRAVLTLEKGSVWRPGTELPIGYHTLAVGDETQRLIVVPPKCMAPIRRAMGIITNLYAVRSDHNWGVGDITDLATIAEWSGEKGAAFVGVNPLHALRNRGTDISPYSPISRLYRNPIYIDVTAVPELSECTDARAFLDDPDTQATLATLRASTQVDYERVWELKRRALEMLHRTFIIRHRDARSGRGRDYRAYIEQEGATLINFATFSALEDHFAVGRRGARLATSGPRSIATPHQPTSSPFARQTRTPSTSTAGSSSSSIASSLPPPRSRTSPGSASAFIRTSRSAPPPTARMCGPSVISFCAVSASARLPMTTRHRDRTGGCRPSIRASSSRIATNSGSR